MKRFFIVIAGMVLSWAVGIVTPEAAAQQVLWGSPVGVDSVTSAGVSQKLDEGFTFQVGAFFENGVSGWAPASGNTEQWADHWLAADSAVYNEMFRTFTGACLVNPIFAGRQGYIWGFDNRSSAGEWILMTDPSWVFPSAGTGRSFPSSWQTSGATVVIVGMVDKAPEAAFHLKTDTVGESAPPFVPGEQWLGMHFTAAQLAEPLISGWGADPDRDGMSNLLEMALGAPPNITGGHEKLPEPGYVEAGGNFFLSLVIRRAPNVPAVLGAEVSSDLVHWESGAGIVTVVSEEPDELIIRDNVAHWSAAERYIRLIVTLEE